MKKDLNYYLNLPYKTIIKKDLYGVYFAEVEELKGCMTQGDTEEEALCNLKDAKKLWLETAIKRKIEIPEPVEEKYSGKFVLRLPKSLHYKLSKNAKKENISLNQYLINLISEQNTIQEVFREIKDTGFIFEYFQKSGYYQWESPDIELKRKPRLKLLKEVG